MNSFYAHYIVRAAIAVAAMYLMLMFFEHDRTRKQLLLMAVAAVAPLILLIVYALLMPSSLSFSAIYMVRSAAPVGAFVILLLIFKVHWKRALLYAGGLLVAAQLTPIIIRTGRAILQPLFGGRSDVMPSVSIFLIVSVLIPVLVWIWARRLDSPRSRALVRCYGMAVVGAPCLLIGHGGGAVVPAAFMWSFVFGGPSGAIIILLPGLVSIFVTGLILLPVYNFVRSQRQVAEK